MRGKHAPAPVVATFPKIIGAVAMCMHEVSPAFTIDNNFNIAMTFQEFYAIHESGVHSLTLNSKCCLRYHMNTWAFLHNCHANYP